MTGLQIAVVFVGAVIGNLVTYYLVYRQKVKEVKKHEQTYDKAFRECRESTVTARYVKSK